MINDERFLKRMSIPKLFWQCTWEKANCPESVHTFAQNLESNLEDGIGMILWGDYSKGKSALSTLILRELPHGKWGMFLRAKNIPKYIIEKTSFDEEWTIEERMHSVSLLVIDEVVFHENDTFRDTCLEDIVRERVSDKLATILTTNLSPKNFQEGYPALAEVCREAMMPVKIEGRDFRREKANELERRF